NIRNHLGDAVVFIDEVQGFRYFDARSMVGFVDGTENPEGQEALAATVIGAEDPDFSGGSYAVVQKYLHDMTSWNELPEKIQEHVIGRTKADDIELSDEEKPANAHNAVTNIEDEDGNELKIMRANLPFGNPAAGEFGTYFIGYAKTPSITERMLSNMFIGEPVGNYDRLLDFSTAVTGTLFFIPSRPLLQQLGA
ncbi:MAG: Dyp-type peroxidase, partial [Neisseriaceae bacterium]|nr:Dyp-type peroxidase [Neisseriaceae bacterium]